MQFVRQPVWPYIARQSGSPLQAVLTGVTHVALPSDSSELLMHVSHASPAVEFIMAQYSVAHCVWQAPLVPHSQEVSAVCSVL